MLRNVVLAEKFGPPWTLERWILFSQGGLRFSLNLFLFSLPLAHITAVREIILGMGTFFWVLLMILNRRILWPRTPLDWPLFGWLVCVLISLLWAVNPAYSFKKIQGEVLKGVVVFYLLAYATQESDHRKQLLFSLTLGNLFMIFYALWDFWQAGGSFGDFSVIRARSLSQSYPEFGTYLITVLPFFLVSFSSPLMKSFRWFLGVLIGLNLFCIYITFGRAMWLAAAVELLLVGWMVNKKKFILFFLAGLLVFALIIPKTVWFHGERINPSEGISSQEIGGTGGDLIEIWKLAFHFFSERPFQGIGYGRNSFSEAFPNFRASHQPLLWHAHNTFLNIAFQTGIQGLLAFLWLIGVILVHTYRRGKTGPGTWSGLWNLSVWIMVIGFFIRNCFDDIYVDDSLLLFWFLVGSALNPMNSKEKTGLFKNQKSSRIKVLSIGWFTKADIIRLLEFRDNIDIVAYDPCEEVIREYRSIASPRLKAECLAVEAEAGAVKLFVDPHNRGATSIKRGSAEDTIEVSAVTFSDVIARHGEFDYVYINCEGCEIPLILSTPIETLLQCAVIFVQFHRFIDLVSDTDIEECLSKLKTRFDFKIIEPRYPNYKFVRKGYGESIKFRFIK